MSFWYKVRRAMSILGAMVFLVFGIATYVLLNTIVPELHIIWEGAQNTILCLAGTIGGLSAFVWGMGWTMDTKERDRMKKRRKEEAEKKRKIQELEKKRAKLLKKHGLSKDIK
jgi:hypothetical protein